MQYIGSPISTICLGQAAYMASLHLAAGGYSGQAKDIYDYSY